MKTILINGIILTLNEQIKAKNKDLCKQNLYCDQVPLHGAGMFIKLAFLPESELHTIAKAAGL